jgi:hypothetical protein
MKSDKEAKTDTTDKKAVDYLEVDSPIAGQNYVCMSFISPDALIQNKETFKCAKFLQSYCKEQKLKFDEVYSKYQDFCYKYEDKLQRDFDEQNDFQTSLRGVKIRGVFDTREAADARAKSLSNTDSSFHVFIGQMGYWLPWDPNADKVTDEHFQNTQLNDMMEKYQENNVNRDIFYEEQKRDKIKAAHEELRVSKEKERKEKATKLENIDDYDVDTSENDKLPEDHEPEPEPDQGDPVAEEEPITASKVNVVSDGIKESLESDDPWMQRKLDGVAEVAETVAEVTETVAEVTETVAEVTETVAEVTETVAEEMAET